MSELKHSYLQIAAGGGRITYGGDQALLKPALRRTGCGVIAVGDLLLYLLLHNRSWAVLPEDAFPLSAERYAAFLETTCAPLTGPLPGLGVPFTRLAGAVNALFAKYGLSFRASWYARRSTLWDTVGNMLENDIPVILSIGKRVPNVFSHAAVPLYSRPEAKKDYHAADVRAHFMTVTAMDPQWLTVSSWGRRYYLLRADFEAYAARKSAPLLCNILVVRRLPDSGQPEVSETEVSSHE